MLSAGLQHDISLLLSINSGPCNSWRDLGYGYGLHSSTQRKRAHLAESMADVARIKFSIVTKKRKGWYLLQRTSMSNPVLLRDG